MGRPTERLLRVDAFRLARAAGLLVTGLGLHVLNGVLLSRGLALPLMGRLELAALGSALVREG